jgi:AcrR family transcriptional regulator
MLPLMSPRPRAASDSAILSAAHRAVTRVGPMRLTLADVAREAGVSPATLVQRFGSKRGLLLALVAAGSGEVEDQWAPILALAKQSPLKALFAYAECMAGFAPTPEVLATNSAAAATCRGLPGGGFEACRLRSMAHCMSEPPTVACIARARRVVSHGVSSPLATASSSVLWRKLSVSRACATATR